MALKVGDQAPDFELEGVDGHTGEVGRFALDGPPAHPLLLVFYPADNSPVCRRQLETYTLGIDEFGRLDVTVWAISPQSTQSHLDFATSSGGFAFPLLSDPDKAVARSYGNLGLLDLYRRSTILVDTVGAVRYVHRYVGPGLAFKPVDELVDAIRTA